MKEPKLRIVRVTYKVTLNPDEFRRLVLLGKDWGLDYDNASPVKIVKRVLQSCGSSGCLAQIARMPKG